MAGFNFGTPGAGGTQSPFGAGNTQNASSSTPTTSSGGLFGQKPTTSTQAPSGGLFSSAGTPTGGLFANTTPSSGAQTSSVFGNKTATGTSTPLFGGSASTGTPPAGLFGTKPATTASGTTGGLFSGGSTTGSSFTTTGSPLFSFGPKTDAATSTPTTVTENKTSTPTASGGLFGVPKPAATGPFGGVTNDASLALTSAPTGTTTPATSKTVNFGTTTPAGPPPTSSQAPKPSGSLFGSTAPQPGGLLGNVKPAELAQKPATSSNLFAANSTPSTSTFFGGAAKAGAASTTPAATITSTTEAPKPMFSFPSTTAPTSISGAQGLSTPATTAPAIPNVLGGAAKSTTPASGPAQTPSLFGNLGGGTSTATSTSTPAPNLFGGAGKSPLAATTTATTSTSATVAAAAAPTASLFGVKPAETSGPKPPSTSAPTAATTATPTATGTATSGTSTGSAQTAAPGPLGASTSGPAPQLSRLKNKTMDEIITRWASDLSKYQKEFQDQAAKVAAWDRLLVENGEKIQKLYLSTFEAERASAEVERQLASVESQQDELAAWLDRYEADVDEMFSRQVGPGESLQGPDQERERTYKLAEKLTDRLDEMGKNLTSMIEAINDASATLNKSSKSDDPLTHIVRVLNSHLTQLQWIDQNAATLQKKVEAAQKLGQSMSSNGFGGQESDVADDFYRSYMGRR